MCSKDQVLTNSTTDETTKPEREALIDWLSFTVKMRSNLVPCVSDLFTGVLESTGHGFNGYSTAMKVPEGGRVAWGGNNDTMLFSFPGKCLGWLYERGVDVALLVKDVYKGGANITRLDLAWDDRSGSFTVPQFSDAVNRREVVSRWRKWREERGLRGCSGHTVYGGSPKSDSCLRVYDKAAETESEKEGVWVRVEWQTRRKVAMAATKLLANGDLDGVAAGLRGYCDWKIPVESDTNNRRWPVRPCWMELLGVIRCKLEVEKPTRTLDSSKQWAEIQWRNTAAALKIALGAVAFTKWWAEVLESSDEDKVAARLAEWQANRSSHFWQANWLSH